MTPVDLIFLYFCAAAVSWAGHRLKVWEERDLERRLQAATIGWRMEVEASIYADKRRIVIDADPNWIPSKFCNNEYLTNEVENRAFIDALWPKRPNPESNPTDCIESGNRKA